ncbi:MAG: HEAT repeat domain-containing protein [Candidatus Latescibacterota bacterium]
MLLTDLPFEGNTLLTALSCGIGATALLREAVSVAVSGEENGFRTRMFRFFRGDFVLHFFHSFLFDRARTERMRVYTVNGLGRAGNPLATSSLLDALDDPSPEVRREAAVALGKVRAAEAVPRLIQEMEDCESDIRSEAAEALGRIGDHTAFPSLLHALGDRDVRLRNTVVSALAALGGEEVREKLLELFIVSYDTALFPALAESLSRLGERSIVEPIMRRLGDYGSMVMRLQLLNAVCRVLGGGNEFYRILSKHEYARVDEVNRRIRLAQRTVRRSLLFQKETASGVSRILRAVSDSYRSEDHRTFLRSVWEFMAYIQLVLPELAFLESGDSGEGLDRAQHRPYIEAVNRFLILKETEDIRDEGMVFLVVCIGCLLQTLPHS